MSKHARWITPNNITVACMDNHAESISNILGKEFKDREAAILSGIANGYVRISLVDNKWMVQTNELTPLEQKHIKLWARKRKVNRPVSIEILGGINYHKAETNIVDLADGVNISRRKILKKAYIAPALIAIHGIPTNVIAASYNPGPPCSRPNPPPWCG